MAKKSIYSSLFRQILDLFRASLESDTANDTNDTSNDTVEDSATETRETSTSIAGNKGKTTTSSGTTAHPSTTEPVSDTEARPSTTEPVIPYVDVTEGDWYYDAVEYLYNEGIMEGTGNDEFSPAKELDRATVVTILYRAASQPEAASEAAFSDVSDGEWYTDAVNWAASVGIVNGYEDGTFDPLKSVSRQELSTIIYRFAQMNGIAVGETVGELGTDAVVSDWADEYVAWAVSEGLLVDGENVDATAYSNRAEVAVAVYTYLTGIVQ